MDKKIKMKDFVEECVRYGITKLTMDFSGFGLVVANNLQLQGIEVTNAREELNAETKKELDERMENLKKGSFINKCECCGTGAQVVHIDLSNSGDEDYRYYLCRNCEGPFVNCDLSKEQFFSMLKNGHTTAEFMLHEDFYDEETGEALQPR